MDWDIQCECEWCQADEHPRFKYLDDALSIACQYLIDMQYNKDLKVEELKDFFINKALENKND